MGSLWTLYDDVKDLRKDCESRLHPLAASTFAHYRDTGVP